MGRSILPLLGALAAVFVGCSGGPESDADGDGHDRLVSGGDDCDDTNPEIHPGVDEDGWAIETIPDDDTPTGCAAVDVDGDGTAHVAYVVTRAGDPTSWVLRYASDAGGTWRSQDVFVALPPDGWGVDLGPLDLEVDGDRRAHVLGAVATGQFRLDPDVVLWSKPERTWDQEWSASGTLGPHALARGSSGALHVLYEVNEQNEQTFRPTIRWATNERGEWASESLGEGWPQALAVDGNGFDHATFVPDTPDPSALRVLSNESGEWAATSIDGGGPSAIVVDGGGTLHVVSGGQGDLRHTWRAGARWQTETFDTWSGAGTSSLGLSVDSSDFLHAIYSVGDRRELRYATNESGSWAVEVLADGTAGDPYCGASIAVGGGKVHVVYADTEQHHATRILPNGVDDDCDGVAL